MDKPIFVTVKHNKKQIILTTHARNAGVDSWTTATMSLIETRHIIDDLQLAYNSCTGAFYSEE